MLRAFRRDAWLCQICAREARIFDCHPHQREPRRACSNPCHDIINTILDRMDGEYRMSENLSDMEKKAIEEAHEDFYQALVKIGCDNAF
jgi:hypothetical protein